MGNRPNRIDNCRSRGRVSFEWLSGKARIVGISAKGPDQVPGSRTREGAKVPTVQQRQ
jgi:hypothetical protein